MQAEKAATAAEADLNDQVLTVSEAAHLLGLRPQTVYVWAKAGKIQAFKVGTAVRLKRGHVLAVLKQQTQPDGRRKYARRTTNYPSKSD
ncbi:helix-turn-helix domain-containing protein [Hymenobacter sp. BT683]|uniref:Helix-turn-helix domain-containing protein n=2 Tax=Hymenobacter jeongseonensis TaxID=2791027 RepID=A0ABS0IM28_9BACT|nr:helix-turn-helix domain-containing protein [Hymenobacter jeongseonensis]